MQTNHLASVRVDPVCVHSHVDECRWCLGRFWKLRGLSQKWQGSPGSWEWSKDEAFIEVVDFVRIF